MKGLGAHDVVQQAGFGCMCIRVQYSLPGVFEVVGRYRNTIAPDYTLAQMKHIGASAVQDFPTARHGGHRLTARILTGKPSEQVLDNVRVAHPMHQRRVQGHWILPQDAQGMRRWGQNGFGLLLPIVEGLLVS